MTNSEKLQTRIVIAQAVDRSPDSVRVIDCNREDGFVLYVLDDFKGQYLILGFNFVPTVEVARDRVIELYLVGVEQDIKEELTK